MALVDMPSKWNIPLTLEHRARLSLKWFTKSPKAHIQLYYPCRVRCRVSRSLLDTPQNERTRNTLGTLPF